MSISLLSVAILLIFFAISAIEISRSIKKGFRQSMISLGIVVSSLLLSVIVTNGVARLLTDLFIMRIVRDTAFYGELTGLFRSLGDVLGALVSMAVGVVVFILVFFITRAILNAFFMAIYNGAIKKNRGDSQYVMEKNSYFDANDKVLGAIAGAISAVIITMVVTAPLMGVLDVAARGIALTKTTDPIFESTIDDEVQKSVDKYSDDVIGNVFYQFGGKIIFNSVASARMDVGRVYLLHELELLDKTAEDFVATYRVFENSGSGDWIDTSSLYELSDDVEQAEMFSGLLAEVLSNLGESWREGSSYLDIEKPATNSIIDPAFNRILNACAVTDAHSVKYNLPTLLKIYAIVLDSGIMQLDTDDYEQVIGFLNDSSIVDDLTEVLEANPYMSDINVSSMAMAAISQHILLNNYDADEYSKLMSELAGSVNTVMNKGYASEQERVDALTSFAIKHIESYGVTVPEEIAKLAAREILKSLSSVNGEVSADDMSELFDSFAK